MAKNSVTDWDETAANNTDVAGVNIDEGCNPSGMNNAVRAVMSQVKAFFKSSIFRLRDSTDQTKLLAFDLSGLTGSATTTVSPPASGGLLATESYATTATAAGTTTLTATSAKNQYFTGTTTQTVVLPVTSTLVLGQQFRIVNNSTGKVTVQSSGANTIQVMGGTGVAFAPGAPGTELVVTCIAITGTGTASWAFEYLTPTTNWVEYTPTITGFGTASSVDIFSRRVGDTLEIRGRFISGTATAVEARLSLGFNGVDGGLTSDATKVPTVQLAGNVVVGTVSARAVYALVRSNLGYLEFSIQSSGRSGGDSVTGSTLTTIGEFVVIQAAIPITGW